VTGAARWIAPVVCAAAVAAGSGAVLATGATAPDIVLHVDIAAAAEALSPAARERLAPGAGELARRLVEAHAAAACPGRAVAGRARPDAPGGHGGAYGAAPECPEGGLLLPVQGGGLACTRHPAAPGPGAARSPSPGPDAVWDRLSGLGTLSAAAWRPFGLDRVRFELHRGDRDRTGIALSQAAAAPGGSPVPGAPLVRLDLSLDAADSRRLAEGAGRFAGLPWPEALEVWIWRDRARASLRFADPERAESFRAAFGVALTGTRMAATFSARNPAEPLLEWLNAARRDAIGRTVVFAGDLGSDRLPSFLPLAETLLARATHRLAGGAPITAETLECRRARAPLRLAAFAFEMEHGRPAPSRPDRLALEGYLASIPACPAGGALAVGGSGAVTCSVHP
jgi:hypothetical protein